VFPSEHNVELS